MFNVIMKKLQVACSSYNNKKALSMLVVLLCLCLNTKSVYGGSTCEAEDAAEDINKGEALKYKIVAIASILIASAIGVCLPMLGKVVPALHPEKNIFFIIKAFAAGVILATGFIHILPDAIENLTSPCLPEHPWGDFPFAYFVAMISALVTMTLDSLATVYFKKSHLKEQQQQEETVALEGDEEQGHVGQKQHQQLDLHTHATHGHAHGSSSSSDMSASLQHVRHRIISQVLELGILVHSVIIGITMGVLESPSAIKPLVAALTFHQLFEGMGLGGCISQAQFKRPTFVLMALFFSLTTPIGIAVGIGITNVYSETSPTALIVQGVLNAAAAGILIYMSLVDLLAADFLNPKVQNNWKIHLAAYVSLFLGAGCMSLLAIWA